MRTTNSALERIEEIESPVIGGAATAAIAVSPDEGEEEPHSKWERVATVATVLIGFQFALLALIGL